MVTDKQPEVFGSVASGFEAVGDAFLANLADGLEVGAACAVYVEGEQVVDIWGGTADVATGRRWDERTLALVYSTTKGVAAICAHLLAQRGGLDLDRPIAEYWPEFAASGKGDVPVRMVLNHQAGLPVIDRKLGFDEVIQSTPVIEALAEQSPVWKPGSKHGYHAATYGWLLGEIVRRACGRSLGQYLAEEVRAPLGLDCWIGLPAAHYHRMARMVPAPPMAPAVLESLESPMREMAIAQAATFADPTSLAARALTLDGALVPPAASGQPSADDEMRFFASEMPSVNGVSDARSLARLYAACVSPVDGVRLLDEETVERATAEESAGEDAVLRWPMRFGLGFLLASPTSPMLGPSSFGHPGAGGSMGCAEPNKRIGFGYVMNKMSGTGMLPDARRYRLIDALLQSLR